MDIGKARIVQFLSLGMAIPDDHPDRTRYLSMAMRAHEMNSSDMAQITLTNPGDILVMYTDGVFDGSDDQVRLEIEQVVRENQSASAKAICNAILAYAVNQDKHLKQIGEEDRIDDKTAFVIKHK